MIVEIKESDIGDIITGYDPSLPVTDYSTDGKDGHFGYGLTGKFDVDVILRLLKACNCKNIFEFGTWLGRTTRILALNLDHVYTLDIPQEDAVKAGFERYQQFGEIPLRDWIGFASKDMPNVTQFYGDSGLIEVMKTVCNGIGKQVDSCFIDADHSYKYVIVNTNQALTMVKRGGLIIWHDVKEDGVVQVIPALKLFSFTVYHVEGTWIGFAIND